ncbi:MAG TPA: VOC family protein [Kaistia sp.]|nr:VOC family protein [Kaistia sp.]
MTLLDIHHIAVVVTDLDRSIDFYQSLFDLPRLQRPPFRSAGAWLACGDIQIHLIQHAPGTFRSGPIDTSDGHFSFRTDDWTAVLDGLLARGFREDGDEDDPMHIVVYRDSVAGFPQLYLRDPDRNIIEINGAPRRHS